MKKKFSYKDILYKSKRLTALALIAARIQHRRKAQKA